MTSISVAELESNARRLIMNSLAPSTRTKYRANFMTYIAFCKTINFIPLPISQNTLTLFATYLCPTHSYKNINAHIAAVKYFSEVHGYDPDMTPYSRLYRILRGIKRTQGARFKRPPRIPITPPLLTQLGHNLWNSSTHFQDKTMLWAAMLTAFHGFLRVSEYTASHVGSYDPQVTLCYTDVSITSPTSIMLHIKASKTDPFRVGTNIHLHRNNSPLCPVRALLYYLNIHPVKSGPLFTWHDARYLTRSGLASVLNRIKPQHVLSMSSHSFRIGAATTAASAGYPRWLIQALGRWTSNCYRDYIRIPQNTLQNVSISLSTTNINSSPPFDPDHIS